MHFRCKLIGTGKVGDSFRVPFPTYRMVSVDYEAGTAVIDILPEDIPEGLPTPAPSETVTHDIVQPAITTEDGKTVLQEEAVLQTIDVRTAVSVPFMAEWHRHLDERYAEHAGEFRHEVL
jgi:hypothetical protein